MDDSAVQTAGHPAAGGRQLGSLTLTRCFNHGQREAVARCPSCRRHYCRECVTEHEYKLLCASCIEALAQSPEKPASRRWLLTSAVQLSAAIMILWVCFYALGQSLLLIPSEFHHFEEDFFDSTPSDNAENLRTNALDPAFWISPGKKTF